MQCRRTILILITTHGVQQATCVIIVVLASTSSSLLRSEGTGGLLHGKGQVGGCVGRVARPHPHRCIAKKQATEVAGAHRTPRRHRRLVCSPSCHRPHCVARDGVE